MLILCESRSLTCAILCESRSLTCVHFVWIQELDLCAFCVDPGA